jgi:hypothetical protein
MTHADRSSRVLRSLTLAWAGLLENDQDNAMASLLRALAELEEDPTFVRVHPDTLDLIVELLHGLRRAGAGEAEARAVALQRRALGGLR